MGLMKEVLLEGVHLNMRSLPDRIEMDHWKWRDLHTSRGDCDEVECQLAIAKFLAEHQERDEWHDDW